MKRFKQISKQLTAMVMAGMVAMGSISGPVFAVEYAGDGETGQTGQTVEAAAGEMPAEAVDTIDPADISDTADSMDAQESEDIASNAYEAAVEEGADAVPESKGIPMSEESDYPPFVPVEPVQDEYSGASATNEAAAETTGEIAEAGAIEGEEAKQASYDVWGNGSEFTGEEKTPEDVLSDDLDAVEMDVYAEDPAGEEGAYAPEEKENEKEQNDGVSRGDDSEGGVPTEINELAKDKENISSPAAYDQANEGEGDDTEDGESETAKSYDVNENIKATLEEGVLTVSGSGPMPDNDYDSPPKWLDEMSEIKHLVIGDGITHVGNWSFMDAYNLESVSLGSVKSIGEAAFCRSGLQSVTIPDSVTSLGYFSFDECPNLSTVVIGKGVKEIPYMCFYDCDALVSVDFGTGVQSMDNLAFAYCDSIETIVLPSNIKELGAGTFGECKGIKTVTTKGLVDVAYQAFFNDSAITSVTLNEGIVHIYGLAFYGCSLLSSVTIPKSVKEIADEAFPANTKIINLNENLEKVGGNGYRIDDSLYIIGTKDYSKAYKVLDLTNKERKAAGLEALKMDASLLDAAMLRAAEIVLYFSHTRPDSSDCFSASGKMFGENIAAGTSSAEYAMDMWMHSEGHRANILNEDFKTIGVGCFEYDGTCYWVQCFGIHSIDASVSKPDNKKIYAKIYLPSNKITSDSGETDLAFDILHNGNSGSVKDVVGKTWQLSLNCFGTKFVSKKVYWKSSDTNVAKVDENGKLTIKGVGTCKITASSRTLKRASITVKGTLDFTKASVGAIGSKVYNGKAFKPAPVVKYKKSKLKKGTDYAVSYKNNKNVGIATVTITGKGSYTGTIKKTFKINPRPTTLSKVAAASRAFTATWKKQAAQTTGYQIQYSSRSDFKTQKTVTVSKAKTISKKISGLAKKRKYYVRIRTYKTVSGKKYYSAWSKAKTVTTK